jgi:TM2 domain-containing membrane protein YozV
MHTVFSNLRQASSADLVVCVVDFPRRRTLRKVWRQSAIKPPGGTRMQRQDTHSKLIGYLLWIFGFLGAHRFYYGKPVTGTIWFFTFGLLFIGWIIDLFLIPAMDQEADLRFTAGDTDYNVAWILLTFLGIFGVHRMYQGKWITGIIYLCTGGLFLLGVLYDFWTLNTQVSIKNAERS